VHIRHACSIQCSHATQACLSPRAMLRCATPVSKPNPSLLTLAHHSLDLRGRTTSPPQLVFTPTAKSLAGVMRPTVDAAPSRIRYALRPPTSLDDVMTDCDFLRDILRLSWTEIYGYGDFFEGMWVHKIGSPDSSFAGWAEHHHHPAVTKLLLDTM
jgi:hypothetical protein